MRGGKWRGGGGGIYKKLKVDERAANFTVVLIKLSCFPCTHAAYSNYRVVLWELGWKGRTHKDR